jgi:hypothetical protein
MSEIKKKYFRLDDELAYRFELQAKKLRISEVKLVSRYIEEGLRRDSNQTTLDEIE